MRRVQSFDDVEHEKPVTINAYHATSAYNADQIRQHGFKVGSDANGFLPDMEKRLGRKHLLGNGVYFADEQRKNHYGSKGYGNLHKVEVTLNRPYVLGRTSWEELKKLDPDKLKADGYDGIVTKGGQYGLRGGENYRQGVAFHPHSVRIVDKHEPVRELVPFARVRHKDTGEIGVVKQVRQVNDAHREWLRQNKPEVDNPTHWVSVKWNGSKKLGTKARIDHNVHAHHVDVVTEGEADYHESIADALILQKLRESAPTHMAYPLYGEAYGSMKADSALTHIVPVDDHGFPAGGPLCKRAKAEHVMDDTTQATPVHTATCRTCRKRHGLPVEKLEKPTAPEGSVPLSKIGIGTRFRLPGSDVVHLRMDRGMAMAGGKMVSLAGIKHVLPHREEES